MRAEKGINFTVTPYLNSVIRNLLTCKFNFDNFFIFTKILKPTDEQ